jgi:hypothetical protein
MAVGGWRKGFLLDWGKASAGQALEDEQMSMTREERDAEIDAAMWKAWQQLLDLVIADKIEAVERLRALVAQEERGWLPPEQRERPH